jgi:hypothetical protein
VAVRGNLPSRVRILIITLLVAFFAGAGESSAGYVAAIYPQGASENVIIDITGAGFNPIASKNTVIFTREGITKENAAVTISSAGTAGAKAGLSRLGVAVPEGLTLGTARVKVVNTVTGETIDGGSIEIIGITLADTVWARPGSSVDIRITGTPNVRFVADGTVTAFGEGVKVNYERVESDTSIVANITVSPDARAGTRSIGLMTESQVAVLIRAFTVKEGPVRLADSGDALGSLDDNAAVSYIFAPFYEDSVPASTVPPAGPKADDVEKVAGGVRHEEANAKAVTGPNSVGAARPQKTVEDAVIPVKTSTAVKAEDVNLVAQAASDPGTAPFVISLKDGQAHVSIVASPEALSSEMAVKPGEGKDAEKITAGPAEKEPFEGASVFRTGELELVIKDLPKDLPATDIVPSSPARGGEEEGGLRKVLVAFLAPFMLIGYLLSHLWNY